MAKARRSNTIERACSPISLGCVYPEDITPYESLYICEDSTADDILKAFLKEINLLKSNLNLEDLDLKELYAACSTCKEPDKSLKAVISLIVDKIEDLEDLVNETTGDEDSGLITLDSCFRYLNADGDWVTSLTRDSYIRLIAQKVCTYVSTISSQGTSIDQLDLRLFAVEKALQEQDTEDNVNSVCTAPLASSTNPVTLPKTQAFEYFEKVFCVYKSLLGTETELGTAIGSEPQPTGNPAGVYSLINKNTLLWNSDAENIGQLLYHYGIALRDLRSAVSLALDSLTVGCDNIVVDIDVKRTTDNLTSNYLTLYFYAKTVIPNGFSDTDSVKGSKFTITDSDGHVYYTYIKVSDYLANTDGFIIDLAATPLNEKDDYTISADVSISNGDFTCVKCINKVAEFKDSGCGICYITAIGSSSANSVAVVSYNDASGVSKILSFVAGEQKIIDSDATNISVTYNGSITLTSNCENIQSQLFNASAYACVQVIWNEEPENDYHCWKKSQTFFSAIEIAGVRYTFPSPIYVNDSGAGLYTAMKGVAPQGFIGPSTRNGNHEIGDGTRAHKLSFQLPSKNINDVFLIVNSTVGCFDNLKLGVSTCTSSSSFSEFQFCCS